MLREAVGALVALQMACGAALADRDSDTAKKVGLYGAWSLFDCTKLELSPLWVFAETSAGKLETYTQLPSGKLLNRSTVRNVRSAGGNLVSYETIHDKGTSFFTVALVEKQLQVMESRNSLGEVLITGGRVAFGGRGEVQRYTRCSRGGERSVRPD